MSLLHGWYINFFLCFLVFFFSLCSHNNNFIATFWHSFILLHLETRFIYTCVYSLVRCLYAFCIKIRFKIFIVLFLSIEYEWRFRSHCCIMSSSFAVFHSRKKSFFFSISYKNSNAIPIRRQRAAMTATSQFESDLISFLFLVRMFGSTSHFRSFTVYKHKNCVYGVSRKTSLSRSFVRLFFAL